jgi:hypothetical protein
MPLRTVDLDGLENVLVGIDGETYRWVDLHGDGVPVILTDQADVWYYKRNFSPMSGGSVELGSTALVAEKPNASLADGKAPLADIGGDGCTDVVVLDGPMAGRYEHDESDESWQALKPFTSPLDRDFSDSHRRLVDLAGDGRADILIDEGECFVWNDSLGCEGIGFAQYSPQTLEVEQGPRTVLERPQDLTSRPLQ